MRSLTLPPIFDLEPHNPNYGFLEPFSDTSTSFFIIALGNSRELDNPKVAPISGDIVKEAASL
ncbi:hypothetical protein PIB30_056609, partial [Stylosanthes scabra]|nr:hypothetical protein [Stylosanthes scabra]